MSGLKIKLIELADGLKVEQEQNCQCQLLSKLKQGEHRMLRGQHTWNVVGNTFLIVVCLSHKFLKRSFGLKRGGLIMSHTSFPNYSRPRN